MLFFVCCCRHMLFLCLLLKSVHVLFRFRLMVGVVSCCRALVVGWLFAVCYYIVCVLLCWLFLLHVFVSCRCWMFVWVLLFGCCAVVVVVVVVCLLLLFVVVVCCCYWCVVVVIGVLLLLSLLLFFFLGRGSCRLMISFSCVNDTTLLCVLLSSHVVLVLLLLLLLLLFMCGPVVVFVLLCWNIYIYI